MSAPLCKNCKHYYYGRFSGVTKCLRIVGVRFDLISGTSPVKADTSPLSERKREKSFWTGRPKCGPAGQFSEQYVQPKPPISGKRGK